MILYTCKMNENSTKFVIASPDLLKQLFTQLSVSSPAQINEQSGEVNEERLQDRYNVSSSGESIKTYMCDGVKYISRLNTARLIGVAPSTLWHWQKAGLLIPIKYGPKKVHYRYNDVIAFFNGKSPNEKH